MARDVAAWIRAAGVDRPDLQIIGHSYGAVVGAHLPAAGVRPATLVLLDPPFLPHSLMARQVEDSTERAYDDLDEAIAAVTSLRAHLVAGRRSRQGRSPDRDRRDGRPRGPPRQRRLGRRPVRPRGPGRRGPGHLGRQGRAGDRELSAGCRAARVRGASRCRPHPHDQGRRALTAADAPRGDARRVPSRPGLKPPGGRSDARPGGQAPSAARISSIMEVSTGATPPPFASATAWAIPSTSCR